MKKFLFLSIFFITNFILSMEREKPIFGKQNEPVSISGIPVPAEIIIEIFKQLLIAELNNKNLEIAVKLVNIFLKENIDFKNKVFKNTNLENLEIPVKNIDLQKLFFLGVNNLLDLAIWYNLQELYLYILNPSNEITLTQPQKNNALLIAIFQNNEEAVKKLIEKENPKNVINLVNSKTINRLTPLMIAAYIGNINIVRLLLQKGADKTINTKKLSSLNTYTALMYAAQKRHKSVIKLLLEYGANSEIKDEWNHTAYDIAICAEHDSNPGNIYYPDPGITWAELA